MDCMALAAWTVRTSLMLAHSGNKKQKQLSLGICVINICAGDINKFLTNDVFRPLQLNPLASQAAVAAAAAMGSIAGSQVFGNTLSNLQGATGQLVTNAQGQVSAPDTNVPIDPSYIQLNKYYREPVCEKMYERAAQSKPFLSYF